VARRHRLLAEVGLPHPGAHAVRDGQRCRPEIGAYPLVVQGHDAALKTGKA
jgi:hypothetical protein